MTDSERHARNDRLVRECHAVFGARVRRIVARLEADGWRPRIQQAWRSPHEQLLKFEQGRTAVRWGYHNATTRDGRPDALACDLVDEDDVRDDGELNLSRGVGYLFALARAARDEQCRTGIEWGLPRGIREGLRAAIAAHDLSWPPKLLGWDPCHVEPADITLALARRGARPLP